MQKRAAKIFGIFLAIFLAIGIFLVYRSYTSSILDIKAANSISCGSLANVQSKSTNFSRTAKILKPLGVFNENWAKKLSLLSDARELLAQLRLYLGCDEERTFLVLLQDNAELRPSGGFWGSYGVLKVKSGEISSFTTANSYDLDLQNEGKYDAPASTEGIFENQWRFWNSNWWPDFKQSADQGLFFMSQVQPTNQFDAVIGVNIDYLLELLKITGDVKVPGYDFSVNQNNFVQKMVYEPSNPAIYKEKGLDMQYINPEEKKPLLADLAKKIIERIFEMNKEKEFALITYQALNNRNAMIYNFNKDQQDFLKKYSWTGEVETDRNIVLICDANVGSKLDFFISKEATLKRLGDGEYEMTLKYRNTYSTASKTLPYSIYRDYLRIFVPLGSRLISFEGGDSEAKMLDKEVTNLSAVKVLLVVSPGQGRTFKFRWRVPENIKNQKLEILKQSGSKLIVR